MGEYIDLPELTLDMMNGENRETEAKLLTSCKATFVALNKTCFCVWMWNCGWNRIFSSFLHNGKQTKKINQMFECVRACVHGRVFVCECVRSGVIVYGTQNRKLTQTASEKIMGLTAIKSRC